MIWRRRKLSTTERERLYDEARGEAECPTCRRCRLPVLPGQRWHAGHELSPHLGGAHDPNGIEHARCNLKFAAEYEVPLIAHNKRVRQKHIGAFRSANPLPGGRDDWANRKIKMDGTVVDRTTGEPWRPR